mgnify:CR=1 FL=1
MEFTIIDPIAGIVVSLFIFKMGYEIVIEAVKQIMDENAGDEMVEQVRALTENVKGVVDSHGIRIRQSGSVYLIDMDILVDGNIIMKNANDICEDVRVQLHEKMERIEEVRVHIDPNCPE